ncbi:hypothetical protein ACKWTF_014768 [Chironomus riparius]
MPSNPSSPNRRSLTPEKTKLIYISPNVYSIKGEVISSTDVVKLPPNLIELRIICGIFYFESDLVDQFRGKKLTIFSNNVFVSQSCTIDLSGIQHNPFKSDAGKDSDGRGLDGRDGTAGDSGGNFALISKTIEFENESILTIISNGADGMDGQNGGDGENGRNGKDATKNSFKVKGFDFKMFNPLCAENREFYKNFELETSQNSAKVTTDDGLTGYVFVQSYNNDEIGLILVKGEELAMLGKPSGCGGFGGEGGLPGKILIQIEQNYHPENFRIVRNTGQDGENGIGGLNGSKGRVGGDCWKYHSTTWNQDPECFNQDVPTKLKLEWGEYAEHSIYDNEKKKFVSVTKVCIIAEPSTEKIRNDTIPRRSKSSDAKPYPKTSIDIDLIIADLSQYLKECERNFIKNKIKLPISNFLSKLLN